MKAKRAIILTGRAGQGHLSVAKAYQYWLGQWGYRAEVYDVLPVLSGKALDLLYKIPKTYKSLFEMSNQPQLAQVMVETIIPEIERKIYKTVSDYEEADLVISTHPLIRPNGSKKPKVMLLPDPVAHAAYFTSPKPDFYFAFWPQAMADAQRFGVEQEKLVYTVPLARAAFYQMGERTLREDIKPGLRRKLKIPVDHLLILVMAGGGWIDRAEPYLDLLRKTFKNEKVVFAFLCGKNQAFLEDINERFGDEPKFRFLGWLSEEEMAEWMSAADFGLAFSLAQMAVEAGLVGLPIFIFRLIEGQEEGYKDVIDSKGVGMYVPGEPENQVALLKVLLRHSKKLFAKNLKSWQKELLGGPLKIKKTIETITNTDRR